MDKIEPKIMFCEIAKGYFIVDKEKLKMWKMMCLDKICSTTCFLSEKRKGGEAVE